MYIFTKCSYHRHSCKSHFRGGFF